MSFALSIAALIAGPFIYALGQNRPPVRHILDGFVFITIAGIVCVNIVPPAIQSGGLYAVGFLLVGLAFPIVLERQFHKLVPRAHEFVLVLAALGLVVHAAIDGIALLPLDGEPRILHNNLALGVILHRVPIGIAIWWSVRPNLGAPVAIGTFVLLILATGAAYWLGTPIIDIAEAQSIAYFQAFVAGSLVHVIAFGVSHDHDAHIESHPARNTWGYRAGILLGMFLIFTLPYFA